MPQENKTKVPNKFMLVVLGLIFIVVVFDLAVFWIKKPSKETATNSNISQTANAQDTVYEGYFQGIYLKKKTIDGVNYSYVIGLVDKFDNSNPIWLTDAEFADVKYYDSRMGSKSVIDYKGIPIGNPIKVTKTASSKNGVIVNSFVVERVN
jgi:hypothetical protein